MFPFNPSTLFQLVLIGVVLFSALALRFGWRWRLLFLSLAIALPTGFLWADPPIGQYAGLAYILLIGASLLTLLFGAILGSALRFARIAPVFSIAALSISAGVFASFILWYQYVPSACLEAPIQVRIAGKTLHIPPEMRPRLEIGDRAYLFGWTDRKTSTARLCRMSQNGTQPIEVDIVWITPAGNHEAMTTACSGIEPLWCADYSPDPYRRIGKILIASAADPHFPLSNWWTGSSLKRDRQGDLVQGSVCLLPRATGKTECSIWQPFGDGFRLTVHTNNLDQTFTEMTVEVARDMIRQAREMTLAIIDQ